MQQENMQVLSPRGEWDVAGVYTPFVINSVNNIAGLVMCPAVIGSDDNIYYATGYNQVTGALATPVVGETPVGNNTWTKWTSF